MTNTRFNTFLAALRKVADTVALAPEVARSRLGDLANDYENLFELFTEYHRVREQNVTRIPVAVHKFLSSSIEATHVVKETFREAGKALRESRQPAPSTPPRKENSMGPPDRSTTPTRPVNNFILTVAGH